MLEDEATMAALRRTCEVARRRAGMDFDGLLEAAPKVADALWKTIPLYEWADRFGIWWGEALWGEFLGTSPELRVLHELAPVYRRAVWREALSAIGFAGDALAGELADAFRAARRERELVDGEAEAVLEDLHRDHALALVTNGAPDVQREKLSRTTLGRYFAAIAISVEVGAPKPDPRIFKAALEQLGVAPEQAAMIGDSRPRDVAGALATGVRAIWLDRGEAWSDGPGPEPDARIHRLGEMRPALLALEPPPG